MGIITRGACRCALALVLGLSISAGAKAQVPNAATGSASPGRIEDQLRPPSQPPRPQPQIEVQELRLETAPEGADKVVFVLREVNLSGITAYSREQIQPLFADRIGQSISLADLYVIAANITRKYRNDGYILTQVVVPPQTIEGGVARLQVVEGTIDTIKVRGGQDSARPMIEAYAAGVAKRSPLNVRDMERALLLINDLPGINARGILSPSKRQAGAADLTVIVDRKPYDAEIFANNFGTKFLGPYQIGAAGSLNSPFGHNERITAQTVLAPGARLSPELMYFALGYLQPVGGAGTTVQLDGSYTDTDPGYLLKPFEVKGKSEFLAATISHPVIRSRRINLTARMTFDLRDVDTKDNLEPTRKDRIRALRAGGRFEYLSNLINPAYNMADIEISQGLNIFGATDSHDLNTSRPGADESFTKVNIELQRLQRIIPNVNFFVAMEGQLADNPLLSSEEFGVGGMNYGRGYDPSEIVGDDGVAGKVELQWQTPTTLPYTNDWQVFGFYDIGTVWNKDEDASALKRDSLASTGFGLRGTLTTSTAFNAVLAFPLTRQVQTHNDTNPRLFIGISQRF